MGNTLNLESAAPLVSDDPVLKEYKAATIEDYLEAKESFDTLQATIGDKMTVTQVEFDEIFSLVCQDPIEHFELFDSWEIGQVDVMEVFAVIIVYCNATVEEKIPLLFDLFDFDHSKEISGDELVLLLLCTSRGLCKALALPRPATDTLEELATDAFSKIDRDRSGQISLDELSQWVLNEKSVMAYLAKFAGTRVIYENQVQCDLMFKEICTTFVNFAEHKTFKDGQCFFFCPEDVCEEIIQRHCPATEKHEIAYLLHTMETVMQNNNDISPKLLSEDNTEQTESRPATLTETMSPSTNALISMDAFCLVISPYVAFLAADDDDEHSIDIKELEVLVWLLRGSEPSRMTVDCFMQSLDQNHDGKLSATEWVSYALETDKRTGSQSFATQLHLLFATADLNGDAMISLPELQVGLAIVFVDHLARVKASKPAAPVSPEAAWEDLTAPERVERRRTSNFTSINNLVAELAKEIMAELDKNQSQRIEWYEFRQHLDYLEQRVIETKAYIEDHVLD